MVELPEAVVIARQMEECVIGKTIIKVTAGHSPHKFAWFSGDPSDYDAYLRGKKMSSVRGIGNNIEMTVEDMILLVSDGPSPRYHKPGEERPVRHQLLVEFEDDSAFSVTIRLWGGMFCFPSTETCSFTTYVPAKTKPSPLTEGFDEAYFEKLLAEIPNNSSLKAFLATEQRIPGLGNGVLQDILFRAAMHPKKKLSTLTREDRDVLFHTVKSVPAEMAESGGRDTETDFFGAPGRYATILSSKTLTDPCPRCGSTLVKAAYMGGNVYFCPGCQKL